MKHELKIEQGSPSVFSNQWNHVNWSHYCKPKKERVIFRTDGSRSFLRDDEGRMTTLGEPIECGTCGIKGTFVKSEWVPSAPKVEVLQSTPMTNDQTECLAFVDTRIAELQTEIDAQEKKVLEQVDALNGARARSFNADPPLGGFHYERKRYEKLKADLGFLRALRSMIEKHGAEEYQLPAKFRGGEKGEMDTFTKCSSCGLSFPCQTITDIKKELGI